MSNCPDGGCYGRDCREDQGRECDQPGVWPARQAVAGQNLREQQQQVQPCGHHHGLVLHSTVTLQPEEASSGVEVEGVVEVVLVEKVEVT